MSSYNTYAVIIYVTETERQAVMRMFDWKEFEMPNDEQEFLEAFIQRDGRKLRIISAQQDEMGMTASATLTMKMIHYFTPEYVIMAILSLGFI